MSNGTVTTGAIAPNAMRLLWAGFLAILAAGIGFGIRGGILFNWAADFGFTGAQLGAIGGAGFTGFCFGIIIGGVVVDKIGYGKLVVAAFLFHVLSAFITFAATKGQSQATAYLFLYIGTFVFALANGTLEAVANPLVSTLFPEQPHALPEHPARELAGGPGGRRPDWLDPRRRHGRQLEDPARAVPGADRALRRRVLRPTLPEVGGLREGSERRSDVPARSAFSERAWRACWSASSSRISWAAFSRSSPAIRSSRPTTWSLLSWAVALGLLFIVALKTNFSLGSLLLFVLFLTHALVGAVELGTDGWIQNITGNILTPAQGKILFVFTSLLMFSLRFCADFIERSLKISPIGLLLICSLLGMVGLRLVSGIDTFAGAMMALAVYAVGKTFFWPTMLAVVGDRFPRTGAVAMSIMGGIGMMSAGLLGGPGLGYAKDRFTAEHLDATAPAIYEQYKAPTPSRFLFLEEVHGLDGTKLSQAQTVSQKTPEQLTPEQKTVVQASIIGDRETLKADAYIPLTMAIIYVLLFFYFKGIGGYRAVHIDGAGGGRH